MNNSIRYLTARQGAFEAIVAVICFGESLQKVLPQLRSRVAEQDLSLMQNLVYGLLREYRAISLLRDELCSRPLGNDARGKSLGIILNLGIFQLLRLELAEYAVINETVKLAAKNNLAFARGLVNAVLRRVQREKGIWAEKLNAKQIFNLPPWLVKQWKQEREKLAAAYVSHPPFSLRLRSGEQGISVEDFLAKYPQARINPFVPSAVCLEHGAKLADIAEFAEGKLSVQDAAAQWAAILLNPQNGERILDACSAPGGKTGHILELAPEAKLTALDSEKERLERVRENLSRLNLSAHLQQAQAQDLDSWWDGEKFSAILLDAPCSGSGVLRRHPDIAFLRTAVDLQNFPKLQMSLLRSLWQTLQTGGRLLYVTCSLLAKENNLLIEQFLFNEPTARLRRINLEQFIDTGFGLLHLPDEFADGFFYALLDKVE